MRKRDTSKEATSETKVANIEYVEMSIESKQNGLFMIKSVKMLPMPMVPKLYKKLAKTAERSTPVCFLSGGGFFKVALSDSSDCCSSCSSSAPCGGLSLLSVK